MDSDIVWQHIDNERAWWADLLESLPQEGWQQPSLCEGWTVRDVGARLTFAHARVRDLLWPAVGAGFRYDAIVKDTAVRSPLTYEQIVATLRGAGTPRPGPGRRTRATARCGSAAHPAPARRGAATP